MNNNTDSNSAQPTGQRVTGNYGVTTNSTHQSGGEEKFPITLFKILQDSRFHNVIAWKPDGASFTIHNKKALEEQVVPQYFQNRIYYRSFLRKLYRWGFAKRFRTTADSQRKRFTGEGLTYFHKAFRRDRPDMCFAINCSPDSSRDQMSYIPIAKDHSRRLHFNANAPRVLATRTPHADGFALLLDSASHLTSTADTRASLGPSRSFMNANHAYHGAPNASQSFGASNRGVCQLASSAPRSSSTTGPHIFSRHQYDNNKIAQELSLLEMITPQGYYDERLPRIPKMDQRTFLPSIQENTTRIRHAQAQMQQFNAQNRHRLATLDVVLNANQGQVPNQASLLAKRNAGMVVMQHQQPPQQWYPSFP